MAYLSEGKLEQAQGFGGQSGGRDDDAGGALDHTAEQVGRQYLDIVLGGITVEGA